MRWPTSSLVAKVLSSLILGAALCSPVALEAADDEIGAYELLDQVRAHYLGLDAYRDVGTIISVTDDHGEQQLSFATERRGDAFAFALEANDPSVEGGKVERVLWRDERGTAWMFDSALGQYRQMPSLTGALGTALGDGGLDALAIAVAVAGSGEPLTDVEAAALDADEPCRPAADLATGASDICRVLLLSRMGGLLESRLWIDGQLWIRRIEVEVTTPSIGLFRDVSRADLPKRPGIESRSRRLVVEPKRLHEADSTELSNGGFYAPPTSARVVDAWRRSPEDPDLPVFEESTSVRLVSFRLRAVDRVGRPIPDLAADDFSARLAGTPIPVVAADWIASDQSHLAELPLDELRDSGIDLEPYRQRLVIFVQAARESGRIRGHMRYRLHLDELLEALGPADEVAVMSFDSHLKLWHDFTTDREAIFDAVAEGMLFANEPPVRRRSAAGELARHFDAREAKRIATPERALEAVARTMAPIDGDKVLVFIGWGLGRLDRSGVSMMPGYEEAVELLEEGRTPVYVLDISEADAHSLEVGLKNVAYATGGEYFRTFRFPSQSASSLASTLSGHYIVAVDGVALAKVARDHPRAELKIELAGRRGRIYGPAKPLS